MMEERKLIRVEYGKKGQEFHLREYRLDGKGSVGCFKDFTKHFPNTEKWVIEDKIDHSWGEQILLKGVKGKNVTLF